MRRRAITILSCSTITWGELKSTKEFDQTLASIRELGYQDAAVEYPMVPPELKKNPEKGGESAKRQGLSVSAVAIDTSPEMGQITRAFGAKLGWLCLFEKDIDMAIEKTRGLVAASSKAGVEVSLHPHVRSNIETTEQLDRIIRACAPNRTSVCFDTAHLTALDINLEKFVDRYAKKISLVHLKDLRKMRPLAEIDYARDFVDLGDGIVDLRRAMKTLRRANYKGAVVVEVDYPQKGTVAASAKKNHEVLTSLV